MSNHRPISDEAMAPAGWYRAEGDPPHTVRYWDGAQWHGGPRYVEPLRSAAGAPAPETGEFAVRQVWTAEQAARAARRQAIRDEQVRRTGARVGEGIPFHELYMRTRSRKGTWRS